MDLRNSTCKFEKYIMYHDVQKQSTNRIKVASAVGFVIQEI